ncbi:MAG: histidine phosphotransferase ChpT [Caulobacterales bacterium]
MSDAMTDSPPADPKPPAPVSPEELAAFLAARLVHDCINSAGAIVSGLGMLDDPTMKDMRDDAMVLITGSAHKLADTLAFSRVAFGASAAAEAFDSKELETLARGVYAHVRPELEWAIEPRSLNKPAARAVLNLAQIGAGALPAGGLARVEARDANGRLFLTVDAKGPRARLHPEVVTGLKGERLEDGLVGRWVQAYYLNAVVKAAGGSLRMAVSEDEVRLGANLPAG